MVEGKKADRSHPAETPTPEKVIVDNETHKKRISLEKSGPDYVLTHSTSRTLISPFFPGPSSKANLRIRHPSAGRNITGLGIRSQLAAKSGCGILQHTGGTHQLHIFNFLTEFFYVYN